MLNFARVLMILAGLFGLPALACSATCSGVGLISGAAEGAPEGQSIIDMFSYASLVASIGSIYVGATAKRLGKVKSGVLCLLFAVLYTGLILQLNFLGLGSAFLLLVAAVMVFVSPDHAFRDVVRVEVQETGAR